MGDELRAGPNFITFALLTYFPWASARNTDLTSAWVRARIDSQLIERTRETRAIAAVPDAETPGIRHTA